MGVVLGAFEGGEVHYLRVRGKSWPANTSHPTFQLVLICGVGARRNVHHHPDELGGFPSRFLRDFLARPHCACISSHGRAMDPSGWPPAAEIPESRHRTLGH